MERLDERLFLNLSAHDKDRLRQADAKRLEALAAAKDWPAAKTIQKLVVAALDAKLLK